MPRLTDEEVYLDKYIDYLKAFAPSDAITDGTPSTYPPITAKMPEFSISTLYLGRQLKLTPYAKEALYIATGFVFTTKVVLTEKVYYKNSTKLRILTFQSVMLRDHGQFSARITDVKELFHSIRKLNMRELSTFTTYREPKKTTPKKRSVRSKTNTKPKSVQPASGLSVDDILAMY